MLPATPPDTVARLVEFVHAWPADARDESATADAHDQPATGGRDEQTSADARRAPAIGER